MNTQPPKVLVVASTVIAAVLALTACSSLDRTGSDSSSTPAPSSTPVAATATPAPYESQFTQDGTFQSHTKIDGVDYVFTVYPTKATPRTNLWYAKGHKYFTFTFQAYDLDRDLRDKFRTKRRVWLDRITVESKTVTTSGQSESPYQLDATASQVTFDPDPLRNRYGMLITSPKGSFELRNQDISTLAPDTRGVDLSFTATVHQQRKAGSKEYSNETIRQSVPIAIFPSTKRTKVNKIPVNAN